MIWPPGTYWLPTITLVKWLISVLHVMWLPQKYTNAKARENCQSGMQNLLNAKSCSVVLIDMHCGANGVVVVIIIVVPLGGYTAIIMQSASHAINIIIILYFFAIINIFSSPSINCSIVSTTNMHVENIDEYVCVLCMCFCLFISYWRVTVRAFILNYSHCIVIIGINGQAGFSPTNIFPNNFHSIWIIDSYYWRLCLRESQLLTIGPSLISVLLFFVLFYDSHRYYQWKIWKQIKLEMIRTNLENGNANDWMVVSRILSHIIAIPINTKQKNTICIGKVCSRTVKIKWERIV